MGEGVSVSNDGGEVEVVVIEKERAMAEARMVGMVAR